MIGLAIDGMGNRLPDEYTELIVCRDILHCTPSELDEQDWERVIILVQLASIEAEVHEHKQKHRPRKPSGKGGGTSLTFAAQGQSGRRTEVKYSGDSSEHH
jgi:hypothetical protein